MSDVVHHNSCGISECGLSLSANVHNFNRARHGIPKSAYPWSRVTCKKCLRHKPRGRR